MLPPPVPQSARRLLLVEDDEVLVRVLGTALERRGFEVEAVTEVGAALSSVAAQTPDYLLADLKVGPRSGLEVIDAVRRRSRQARCVVLTSYANVSVAVEAVKLGADEVLPKPVDADEVVFALLAGREACPLPERLTPVETRYIDHILGILDAVGGNVSIASERLDMHRRTLQRILKRLRAANGGRLPEPVMAKTEMV